MAYSGRRSASCSSRRTRDRRGRDWSERSFVVTVGAALLCSCNLADNVEGLGKTLLDPEASTFGTAEQLASGDYHKIDVAFSDDEGLFAVALDESQDEPKVTVAAINGRGSCTTGPVDNYQVLKPRQDPRPPVTVAILEQETEAAEPRLSFVGASCKSKLSSIANPALPLIGVPRVQPKRYLARTLDQRLYVVDPAVDEVRLLTSSFDALQVNDTFVWTLEQGTLIVRDGHLREIARHGSKVTELVLSGAALSGGDGSVAYVDGGKLHLTSSDGGEATVVAADACNPVPVGEHDFAFLAPCAERGLGLAHFAAGAHLGEFEVHRFAGPARDPAVFVIDDDFGASGDGLRFLYLTSSESDSAIGELWLARVNDADERESLGEAARLSQCVYLTWDGRRGDCALPVSKPDGSVALQHVAENVIEDPRIRELLVDYDETGTLIDWRVTSEGVEVFELARRVPRQRFTLERHFVSEFDGTAGVLTAAPSEFGKPAVRLAPNALPSTLIDIEEPDAVAYLGTPARDGAATLRAWIVGQRQSVEIASEVQEYRSLRDGLLYAKRGDGLWLLRGR